MSRKRTLLLVISTFAMAVCLAYAMAPRYDAFAGGDLGVAGGSGAPSSLATPTGLSWKEDSTATATWDAVEGANYYSLHVYVFLDNGESVGSAETGTDATEIDLQSQIESIIDGRSGESFQVQFDVKAKYIDDAVSLQSETSGKSATITVSPPLPPLATPTGLTLSEAGILSWDGFDASAGGYDYEFVFRYQGSEATTSGSSSECQETGSGGATADLSGMLRSCYGQLGYNGETVEVSVRMKALADGSGTHSDSAQSSPSNAISYTANIPPLATPTGLTLSEAGILSWDGFDASAGGYDYEFVFRYQGSEATTSGSSSECQETGSGGATADLSGMLRSCYGQLGYNGETVEVSVRMKALADGSGTHSDSAQSSPSNAMYYCPGASTWINGITLSPSRPIVAVGRGIYIGQTIAPEDAHYSEVRWSSDDESVFTVNGGGLVTGVAPGNANLTAQINNATATVPVSVYQLTTNIADENEAATVEDAASDAIEGIVGGDVTGTDLDDTGIDSASSDIENAAQEGDQFSADLTVEPVGQDQLSVPWEDVWEYTKGWHFGSASGVRIALGYTQKNGKFHLVCNLTSLDGPVSFELPAPEDLPPVPAGKNREYKLVTIHGKEIKELPYIYRDGRFYAASNEFSDFVLVYQDTGCDHEWGNHAFNWSENGKTCSVTYTCTKDPSHTRTEACEVTSKQKSAATCSAKGVTTYTATYGGDTDSKDVADIPIDFDAHDWGEPVYKWSSDCSTCTATRTCELDEAHSESETVRSTSSITKERTATEKGKKTYVARFSNPGFAEQRFEVEVTTTESKSAASTSPASRTDSSPVQARRFPDVPEGSWYYGVVYRAAGLGLINGYKDGRFGPNDNVTRGQVAVILWNMAGKPSPKGAAKSFPDVKAGKYYYDAVAWASSVGVVNGYRDGRFGPDDLVTREQLAAMLANYAGRVAGKDTTGSAADYRSMKDAAKVSSWAAKSVGWCFRNKIISGTKDGRVNPQGNATRAETAKMVVFLHDML